MELDRINILVDRYFEGETTLDEERELKEYLATAENIPEEYVALKIMLGVVTSAQEIKAPDIEQKHRRHRSFGWRILGSVSIAAAAAAIIIMLVAPHEDAELVIPESVQQPTLDMQYDIVCHVNGERITDKEVAYGEANRILNNVASDMQLAMAQVSKLNIQGIK